MKSDTRSTLIIRPFIEDDLQAMFDIEKHSEYARWSRKGLEDEVSGTSPAIVLTASFNRTVAYDTIRVAGYISFAVIMEEMHIRKIAVHPQFRMQGIASALVLQAEAHAVKSGASRAVLEVAASNVAAKGLYMKSGFEFTETGNRKGSAPLVMVKTL